MVGVGKVRMVVAERRMVVKVAVACAGRHRFGMAVVMVRIAIQCVLMAVAVTHRRMMMQMLCRSVRCSATPTAISSAAISSCGVSGSPSSAMASSAPQNGARPK